MSVFDLERKAKQTEFSELVGTSQPAIANLVKRGILRRNASYGEWLQSYCDRLRTEAAGRGADNNAELTRARIDESRENTLAKRQDRLTKAKVLVVVDEVAHVVEELGSTIKSSTMGAGDRILQSIEDAYSIELDEKLVYEPLRNSLRNIATSTSELVDSIQRDDGNAAGQT